MLYSWGAVTTHPNFNAPFYWLGWYVLFCRESSFVNNHTLIYTLVLLRLIYCQASIGNRIKKKSDLKQLILWIFTPWTICMQILVNFLIPSDWHDFRYTCISKILVTTPQKCVVWNLYNIHKDKDTYKIMRKDSKLIFLLGFFLSYSWWM